MDSHHSLTVSNGGSSPSGSLVGSSNSNSAIVGTPSPTSTSGSSTHKHRKRSPSRKLAGTASDSTVASSVASSPYGAGSNVWPPKAGDLPSFLHNPSECTVTVTLRELRDLQSGGAEGNVLQSNICVYVKYEKEVFSSRQYALAQIIYFHSEDYHAFKVKNPNSMIKINIYKVDEKGEKVKRLGKLRVTMVENAMKVNRAQVDCWWPVNQQLPGSKTQAYMRIYLDYDSSDSHRKRHAHGMKKKAASSASMLVPGKNSLKPPEPEDQKPKLVKEKSAKDMMQLFASCKIEPATLRSWEINKQELTFEEELAEGVSAKVFKGKYRNQQVAIKVLKETLGPKEQNDFEKEFELLMSIRSPQVVFFYGICSKPTTCIVLEWCENGSLYDYMKKPNKVIDWGLGLRYMVEIVRAVNTLHNWKPLIVHRDLKSQNILVADNGSLKLCDLGLARSVAPTTDNMATLGKVRGTYQYTAPELYSKQQYTAKADIFSIGVILWEITSRIITREYMQPFSEYKHLRFDFQIYIQIVKTNLRPTIPPTCPEVLSSTIKRCWDTDPELRPTTAELLEILTQLKDDYAKNKAPWEATILPLEEIVEE